MATSVDKRLVAPFEFPIPIQPKRSITVSSVAYPLTIALLLYLLTLKWPPLPYCVQTPEPIRVKYEGELVSWVPCGEVKGRPLECSNVTVPMDHFSTQNLSHADELEHTFTIPLIRMRSENATENILINPGGPGGSGVGFLYRIDEELITIIGKGYHILSFDPRGINGSIPKAECYPDEETRRALSRPRTARLEDSGELYSWTKNYVQACYDTMGEHARYINTPQTAADMDLILDSVGQKDMVYWGFSYGTILGQTYATMYPERSKRVIIDGVGNVQKWYGHLDREQEWCTDSENALRGFFDECIKAGPDNCRLAELGSTGSELWDVVISFLNNLKEEPLSVYVNNTVYGLLDYDRLLRNGLLMSLFSPQRQWYFAADTLAKLIQGNATQAYMVYGRDDALLTMGEANQIVMYNDGENGAEYWPQNRQDLVDELVSLENGSIFSLIDVSGFFGKQQWTLPRGHNFVPQTQVKTAHPLLILSTSYDPACPLVSAKVARQVFEGSQIVEAKTYGHCSVAMPSDCIARHVRGYLYQGKVPANHTRCDVEGDYFVHPEECTDG